MATMDSESRLAGFRTVLDERPVGRFQTRLLVLVVMVLVTDGYDTQSIGYVAPVLGAALHVARGGFGPVFSAGLLGATIGALLLTPLADRFGARRVLIGCTAAYACLTLLTCLVTTLEQLIAIRFLAGLGLGGAMPTGIALVSAYAPTRRRTLMVTVAVCGFSLGGALGGAVAAATLARFGWPSVFLVGGIVPLLLLPFLGRELAESPIRLFKDTRMAGSLASMLAAVVPGWAPSAPGAARLLVVKPRSPVRLLFAVGYAAPTLLIWCTYFCNLVLLYFLANWLPTVMNAAGMSLEAANLSTAGYQGAGTIGALALAWVCDRSQRSERVLAAAFACAAVFCAFIGSAGASSATLVACVAGAGFCVVGGQNAMNAFVGTFYPASNRATGIGWALGIGRFGSIFGPLIGGVLIAFAVATQTMFVLFAVAAVIASSCMLLLSQISGRRGSVPDDLISGSSEQG